MTNWSLGFLSLIFISSTSLAQTKKTKAEDMRASIGSTFSSPISYQGKYYFVATTGVLYESNSDMSKVDPLFSGKNQTLGQLTLVDHMLYWGEGLHDDKKTMIHAFDLKTKKMVKEIEVDGHIQRGLTYDNGVLFTGLGMGGVSAFKVNTLEKIWNTTEYNKKKLHVDGNVVLWNNQICTSTIYDMKAVLCLDSKTGKVISSFEMKKNPKGEMVLAQDRLVGLATDADMVKGEWTKPADFFVIDLKLGKIKVNKELRGFNFFAPLISGDQAFITLSTGDFLILSLNDGKIGFLGEFPEPFVNAPFMMKESYCGLGVMGKLLCYSKNKNAYGISHDKRFMETPVGKVAMIGNNFFAPSRVGYFLID